MVTKLLKLNGLAIFGTVLNHTHGWGLIAMFLWTHRYKPVTVPNFDQLGSPTYYFLRIIEQLIAFSIPAFLLVSGYFVAFSTGQNKSVKWKTVITRIKFLIIPYLVWCAILVVGYLLEGNTYTPISLFILIVTGEIEGPYYFVPLLIQLYLISPILVLIAKKSWKTLLIGTAIIQLFAQLSLYLSILGFDTKYWSHQIYIPGWFFPSRIFWFALGIVFGFHLSKIKSWLPKIQRIAFIATIFFYIIGVIEWELVTRYVGEWVVPIETIIDSLYAISFLFLFLSFDKVKLPLSSWIQDIGSKSLGIYLAHVPAQGYPSRIIYHIAPWILGRQFIFLPLIFILGLGIPLGLMKIVNVSPARRYYKYIFG